MRDGNKQDVHSRAEEGRRECVTVVGEALKHGKEASSGNLSLSHSIPGQSEWRVARRVPLAVDGWLSFTPSDGCIHMRAPFRINGTVRTKENHICHVKISVEVTAHLINNDDA